MKMTWRYPRRSSVTNDYLFCAGADLILLTCKQETLHSNTFTRICLQAGSGSCRFNELIGSRRKRAPAWVNISEWIINVRLTAAESLRDSGVESLPRRDLAPKRRASRDRRVRVFMKMTHDGGWGCAGTQRPQLVMVDSETSQSLSLSLSDLWPHVVEFCLYLIFHETSSLEDRPYISWDKSPRNMKRQEVLKETKTHWHYLWPASFFLFYYSTYSYSVITSLYTLSAHFIG